MTIFDVIEYGPIVACDEDRGLLITINGSYLNLWVRREHVNVGGGVATPVVAYDNIDCRSGHPDLYTLTVAQAMRRATEWLGEL